MLFYLVLAICVAILTELSFKLKSKFMKSTLGALAIFLPSFFAAVRYNVGTDFHGYVAIFEEARVSSVDRIERGYIYINWLVQRLGGGIELVFFITTLIIFCCIYFSLKRYSNIINPGIGMLTFMFFYYQMSFNILRQVIAMSIFLYSIKYIIDKKFVKFLFCTILAANFHSSMIVAFLAYFINLINVGNLRKQKKIIMYIVVVLATVFLYTWLPMILGAMGNERLLTHIASERTGDTGIGFLIRQSPIIIIGLYFSRYTAKNNRDFDFLFTIYIISILLNFSVFFGGDFVERIALNYQIVLVLLVPYYYKCLNMKFGNWGLFLLLYTAIHWWYRFVLMNSGDTLPYQWIF